MVAPANKNNTTIAVIGAGPAGMISALAAAQKGYSSYLIGPKTNNNDLRTTALMMPAIKILDSLGIWKNLQDKAAALSTMRIVDGTKRLIRSPVVSFHSSEIGEIAFGYNMPNVALNNAINEAVTGCKLIKRLDVPAKSIVHSDDHVAITLEDNSHVDAQLLIAADGRNSKARIAAGIDCRQWNYPQTAVILSFSHEFPHNDISTEFHTEDGPFTQVPLPGKKSSLVWVLNPERANRILGLGPEGLASAIEERMQAMLGKVTVITPAQSWPLSGIVPKSFADKRTILVGEAAHVFPPIGAQGLNLGIRDAINMVKAIESDSKDPGSEQVMENYNKYRKADIWVRTGSVHALNKALLSDMLPVQFVRSAGLELLRNFAPLRNIFMREGMYPGNGLRALAKVLCPTSKSGVTN
ncbi:UbiH/UbiF family hydroxylase [uncultured Bartonella sp.]|uniref:UbiH/UbiF family hydroxylase n=1 Tax=uncultured Bartonella sp. TaxID=104108 RepID=UPI0025F9AC51|nr:UbiH/UbiF family hydroxylase [uncultured Bartonella sp.]